MHAGYELLCEHPINDTRLTLQLDMISCSLRILTVRRIKFWVPPYVGAPRNMRSYMCILKEIYILIICAY
jgi:hypothetical protein